MSEWGWAHFFLLKKYTVCLTLNFSARFSIQVDFTTGRSTHVSKKMFSTFQFHHCWLLHWKWGQILRLQEIKKRKRLVSCSLTCSTVSLFNYRGTLQTHPCNENRVIPVNFFSQGNLFSLQGSLQWEQGWVCSADKMVLGFAFSFCLSKLIFYSSCEMIWREKQTLANTFNKIIFRCKEVWRKGVGNDCCLLSKPKI